MANESGLRNAELSGATEGWTIMEDDRAFLRAAVAHLMSCSEHHGVHHFAITGEGRTLWCSPVGIECINSANLGGQLPLEGGLDT